MPRFVAGIFSKANANFLFFKTPSRSNERTIVHGEPKESTANKQGTSDSGLSSLIVSKRKRTGTSARERNLRRLESNERERLRMHGLNAAFEVKHKNAMQ